MAKEQKTQKRTRIRSVLPTLVFALLVAAGVGIVVFISSSTALSSRDEHAPRIPQGVEVAVTGTTVHVSWKLGTEEDLFTYVVDVRPVGTEPEEQLIGKTDSVSIPDLPQSRRVIVRVAAEDGSGNRSDFSPDMIVQTDGPGAIQNAHAWTPVSADAQDVNHTFTKQVDVFSSVSPFQYDVGEDGTLLKKGDFSDEIRSAAQEKNVKIIPTVTNVNAPDETVSSILKDQERVTAHIENIVREVGEQGYDGIDLNYESLGVGSRDVFTSFVERLAARLHSDGKELSITVQPKASDAMGAADFGTIGGTVDQLRIMTYDAARQNTLPGPIAPLPWVEERIEYALERAPAEKVVMGIPLYGYQWCTGGGSDDEECEAQGLTWDAVQKIIAEEGISPKWDDKAQSPWFRYEDEDGHENIVYYEDARSIHEKLVRFREMGVTAVVFWRLGSEDPKVFDELRSVMSAAQGPENLRVVSGDEHIVLKWNADETSIEEVDWQLSYKEQGRTYITPIEIDPGQNEVFIHGLENGTPVDVFLESKKITTDDPDEQSVASLATSMIPFITVVPGDLIPPSRVDDFRIEKRAPTFVEVAWTVPPEEDVSAYDLRVSGDTITSRTFWDAVQVPSVPEPESSGSEQKILLRGLTPGEHYMIALQTEDDAGNASDMSNILEFATEDTLAPHQPRGLHGFAGDGKATLTWMPNNEKDLAGYRLYYRSGKGVTTVIDVDAHATDVIVPDLPNEMETFFQLTAFDRVGNESGRTEMISLTPRPGGWSDKAGTAAVSSFADAQATISEFANIVKRPGAIPYLVMGTIILFNIFLFKGVRNDLAGDLVKRRTRDVRSMRREAIPQSMGEISHTRTRPRPISARKKIVPRATQPITTQRIMRSPSRTTGSSLAPRSVRGGAQNSTQDLKKRGPRRIV